MKMYQIILTVLICSCFAACGFIPTNKHYKLSDYEGLWEVEMKSTFSDCISPIQTLKEQWNIICLGNDKLRVETIGSDTKFEVYEGVLTSNGKMMLSATRQSDTHAKIGVNLKNSLMMEGTRYVEFNEGYCETFYLLRLMYKGKPLTQKSMS